MIADNLADMTPVAQVRQVETQQSAFTQLSVGVAGNASTHTRFSALGEYPLWPSSASGTGEALAGGPSADSALIGGLVHQQADEIESAASVRALMLARKFGAGSSREHDSRIEILTARLRKLAPRVTEEQIDLQAEMVSAAESISSRLSQLRERIKSA